MIQLPSPSKVAAFDVDAQKGFTPLCPDELPVPEGHLIVAELNAQARFAGTRVFSKDSHPANPAWLATPEQPMLSPVEGENMDVRWNLHCVPGTKGFELLDGLPAETEYDFPVYKGVEPDMHPYGACYHDLKDRISTGVIEVLKARGVEIVLVGGLATDYCVKTTALQLKRAGFNVVVNLGACRGIAPDTTEAAIAAMKDAGVAMINSAAELTQ